MAFGFKFGGDKGPVAKLAAGKLSDPEKQQLLVQLSQASPPAQELVVLLCNDDSVISSRAAQLFLAKADGPAVSELVEDLLGRTQGFATGLKVLQKCRDDLVVNAVEPYLTAPRPDLMRKLWELLFELAPAVSEKYLVRALAEAPGPQRVLALKRLVKSRGEQVKPLLIEASANREGAVRKEAVTLLAAMPGEDIFATMLERLSTDDSREVRDVAGNYLQQYISKAPPDVKPRVLGRLLLSGEPEQKKALVQSMFSQGKPDELLVGVLSFCKTITGVQHRTVMDALKTVGDPLLQPTLAIMKGNDVDLRVQAVYLLEAYADPRTAGALLQMLRDPDWWVRIVVCEAVGRMKEPKTIPSLREMFVDADA
jgi:hypothetical protein